MLNTEDFIENGFDDKYYDWNKPGSVIKIGRFYNDPNLVGILTHRKDYGTNLLAVNLDLLDNNEYPVLELDTNIGILGNYTHATYALSDLNQNGQEEIIVHSKNGLNIYRLSEDMSLEQLIHVPNTTRHDDSEEKLFFPNLTGQSYRDIVLFNHTGLFVYQYNDKINNYALINYQPNF